MRKGDIIEITIEDVLFPNKAIATYEGKPVIVKNALLGQTILAKISKVKKAEIEAKLVEVIKTADYEKDKICAHFGLCGGCLYQTIPYEKQVELKENQVQKIIDEVTTDYEMLPIVKSPRELNYRNKMEFSFGDDVKDGPLTLGLHQKNRFYEIITVDDCQIVDEDFRVILTNTLKYFLENNTTYYHKRTKEGFLRYLVVRKTAKTEDILINLVTSSQGTLNEAEFINMLNSLKLSGTIKCITQSITDSIADVVKAEEMKILYGEDKIEEELLGLKFNISAFSFFQTNSLGAEELYSVVRDFIGDTKDKVIYDLYSGTGTIGQIVSKNAKKVIGIEIVEEAVVKANENVKLNNIQNCTFIAGDVLEKVDELTNIDGANKPDIIILDPPREGIHPKALKKIINYNPNTFIYISCKPTSLTKDLPEFLSAGYKIEKVRCVDMFPMTPHVETVILMSKKPQTIEITTDRLYIREISTNDTKDLKRIIDDFESSEYAIYDGAFPKEEQAFQNLVKRLEDSHLFFSVFLQNTKELIGYVCFHNNDGQFDLGYCFHSDYKGKGYAYEACLSTMQYMKKCCGVKGFTAGTALANTPSCKLLEKLGFVCTDTEELSFHKDELGNDIVFKGGKFVKN